MTDSERVLLSFEARRNALLRQLLSITQDTFDAVWEKPESMLAAQGVQATANFEDHARTVAYLIGMGVDVPAKYQAAPVPYTIKADGTITLK